MKLNKLLILSISALALTSLTGCNAKDPYEIIVGATPSPHAQILNSSAVQNYVREQGYKLTVKVYQDYITPNRALNDEGIDANYFQHLPYLNTEIEQKGYNLSPAAYVHCEPLSLYHLNPNNYVNNESFRNKTISIINDVSNATRALELLKLHGVINSYDLTNFDIGHLNYESDLGVTINAIAEGLLTNKVVDGGLAVIPGNFALTKWGASQAEAYKIYGETVEAAKAKANIIAVKTENLHSDKTNVLINALNQASVNEFITENYGSTVLYAFEDLR